MATYRTLVPLYLPHDIWVDAGTIISDAPGGPIPVGWPPPTNAVDPVDGPANTAYQALGPGVNSDAEPYKGIGPWWMGQRWTGVPVAKPVHYWKQVPGTNTFTLT